jgi:uncharacterized protein (DUF736 family)
VPINTTHELGHGTLGLEHPFKTDADQGKTNFLMDYSVKNELWHKDWQQINDPKFRLYNFQGDESGESFDNLPTTESGYIGYKLDNPMIFLSLGGKAIKLPKDAIVKFYCVNQTATLTNGLLIGFKVNGIEYLARSSEIDSPTKDFTGYYKIENNKFDLTKKYLNSDALSVGTNYPINYLNVEKNSAGLGKIKIIEINKVLIQAGYEPLNGAFGGKRLNSNNTLFDYAQATTRSLGYDKTFLHSIAPIARI